jgi:hypothetical protein
VCTTSRKSAPIQALFPAPDLQPCSHQTGLVPMGTKNWEPNRQTGPQLSLLCRPGSWGPTPMTPLHDRARTLQRVCEALAQGDRRQASEVARREYPFAPQTTRRSAITPAVATSVFLRDGFIDRYSVSVR